MESFTVLSFSISPNLVRNVKRSSRLARSRRASSLLSISGCVECMSIEEKGNAVESIVEKVIETGSREGENEGKK